MNGLRPATPEEFAQRPKWDAAREIILRTGLPWEIVASPRLSAHVIKIGERTFEQIRDVLDWIDAGGHFAMAREKIDADERARTYALYP